MRTRTGIAVLAVAAALAGAASFAAGRATAPPGDYLAGLRAGEAQGRQVGRAEQEGAALPPGDRTPVRDAFDAGYVAGTNDAFALFDGGWTLGVPWIVTLERGTGPIDYRIASRTPVTPGTDFFLCPDGRGLCRHPR